MIRFTAGDAKIYLEVIRVLPSLNGLLLKIFGECGECQELSFWPLETIYVRISNQNMEGWNLMDKDGPKCAPNMLIYKILVKFFYRCSLGMYMRKSARIPLLNRPCNESKVDFGKSKISERESWEF